MTCEECGYCSDCVTICPDCEVCENCTNICEDCGLCENCCADVSESYGCGHEICIHSSEWRIHYCSEGEHCVEDSAEVKFNENSHWTVCGDGCDAKLDESAHTFGEGEVKREATDSNDGIVVLTCTVCDYEKEVTIPKTTGTHTHEYKVTVTEPTCTESGYTTHTCSCGHSWVDGEVLPVGHNFKYKYTAQEHWKECTYCGTKEASSAHKMGEWKTVTKPGYTYEGVRQSTCKLCGYTLADSIPMLEVPEDKYVLVIPDVEITETGVLVYYGNTTNTKDPENESQIGSDVKPIDPSSENLMLEYLTKGDGKAPALPTLPPTEDGNIFEGWVDASTGEFVKKGDSINSNIVLEPKWKDCGEGNHEDTNEDLCCDECGYIFNRTPAQTEDESSTENEPTEVPTDDNDVGENPDEKMPIFIIVLMAIFGLAVVLCGGVIVLVSRKKSKEDKEN